MIFTCNGIFFMLHLHLVWEKGGSAATIIVDPTKMSWKNSYKHYHMLAVKAFRLILTTSLFGV